MSTFTIKAKSAEDFRAILTKAQSRSLYVCRKVKNASEIIRWAKAQGFEVALPADEMHVTVTYSRTPVDWMKMGEAWGGGEDGGLSVTAGGPRIVEPLGDKGAVVLFFTSSNLSWRHEEMVRAGASWDHEGYQPHVTITYQPPTGLDLKAVEPYRGKIELGPEIFEEIDPEGFKAELVEKGARVVKVSEELGLVFGFAIVCKIDGEDYYDLNVDREGKHKGKRVPEHIPEDVMLQAASDFMEKSERPGNEMHVGPKVGKHVFAFPLTSEIAASLDIETRKTGMLVAYKAPPEVIAKFKDGTYTGFSIEGFNHDSDEVDDG